MVRVCSEYKLKPLGTTWGLHEQHLGTTWDNLETTWHHFKTAWSTHGHQLRTSWTTLKHHLEQNGGNLETTTGQLWDNCDASLRQLWDNFKTTLRELWATVGNLLPFLSLFQDESCFHRLYEPNICSWPRRPPMPLSIWLNVNTCSERSAYFLT